MPTLLSTPPDTSGIAGDPDEDEGYSDEAFLEEPMLNSDLACWASLAVQAESNASCHDLRDLSELALEDELEIRLAAVVGIDVGPLSDNMSQSGLSDGAVTAVQPAMIPDLGGKAPPGTAIHCMHDDTDFTLSGDPSVVSGACQHEGLDESCIGKITFEESIDVYGSRTPLAN